MKVEWEFSRKHKAIELLPRILIVWWKHGPLGVDVSWLNWGFYAEFYNGKKTCR